MVKETAETAHQNNERFGDAKNIITAQVYYLQDLATALELAGNDKLAERLYKVAENLKFSSKEISECWTQEFKWKLAATVESTGNMLAAVIAGSIIGAKQP